MFLIIILWEKNKFFSLPVKLAVNLMFNKSIKKKFAHAVRVKGESIFQK